MLINVYILVVRKVLINTLGRKSVSNAEKPPLWRRKRK